MSWSVGAVGKPAAVAAKLAADIAKITCSEPEETIKNKVGEIIAAALAVYPEGTAVRVTAAGSQSSLNDGKATNSLSFSIDPVWGFVE